MTKNYAVIVDGKVTNVIVADESFIKDFEAHCAPFEEVHSDDSLVARIGDSYVDGKFITPSYTPSVPQSITRIQAMKILKSMGLWETFKSVLSSNQDAQDEWDLATELQRSNEFVTQLMPVLNLTDTQLDDLFTTASTL